MRERTGAVWLARGFPLRGLSDQSQALIRIEFDNDMYMSITSSGKHLRADKSHLEKTENGSGNFEQNNTAIDGNAAFTCILLCSQL